MTLPVHIPFLIKFIDLKENVALLTSMGNINKKNKSITVRIKNQFIKSKYNDEK